MKCKGFSIFLSMIYNVLATSLMWLMLYSSSLAAEKLIRLNVTDSGYPPYLVHGKDQHYSGIVVDVLTRIADKHGYQVRPVIVPKNRQIRSIDSGAIDTTAMAIEWVPYPELFLFTDVILEAKDVLFSRAEQPVSFASPLDLVGKQIGAHLGYIYPALDTEFKSGRIKRINAHNESAILGMLEKERTDAAVVNKLVGQWLIKQNPHWHNRFAISDNDFGGVGLRLIFAKRWQSFVLQFNTELTRMKQSGELADIISNYL